MLRKRQDEDVHAALEAVRNELRTAIQDWGSNAKLLEEQLQDLRRRCTPGIEVSSASTCAAAPTCTASPASTAASVYSSPSNVAAYVDPLAGTSDTLNSTADGHKKKGLLASRVAQAEDR